jgi:hypothetical protein
MWQRTLYADNGKRCRGRGGGLRWGEGRTSQFRAFTAMVDSLGLSFQQIAAMGCFQFIYVWEFPFDRISLTAAQWMDFRNEVLSAEYSDEIVLDSFKPTDDKLGKVVSKP